MLYALSLTYWFWKYINKALHHRLFGTIFCAQLTLWVDIPIRSGLKGEHYPSKYMYSVKTLKDNKDETVQIH